jgi:hypothetical protein
MDDLTHLLLWKVLSKTFLAQIIRSMTFKKWTFKKGFFSSDRDLQAFWGFITYFMIALKA